MKSFLKLLAAVIALWMPAAYANEASDATKSIWDRHVQSALAHDLEAVMADFTEQSVIITTDRVYAGLDAIRGFFVEFLKGLTPEAVASMVVLAEVAHDEVMFFTFSIGAIDRTFVDTAVVRGGKILTLTNSAHLME